MGNYLQKHGSKSARAATPQTEKLPGSTQIRNDAGGYAWKASIWTMLDRFLILGAEGGTYYATEQKTIKRASKALDACLAENPERTVGRIAEVSNKGLAVSNDPALWALAKAAAAKDAATRKLALEALPSVCRTGTHLHHFASYIDEERSWGRGVRRAVGAWFTERSPEALARQILKYPSRDGWSMRDVLRSAHPPAPTMAHEAIYRYATQGMEGLHAREVRRVSDGKERTVTYPAVLTALPEVIAVVEDLRARFSGKEITLADSRFIAEKIETYSLDREMLPTEALTSVTVWEALLPHMRPEAMLRNLGVMSALGMLGNLSANAKFVAETLADAEVIRAARLHPLRILVGLKTYASGHGLRGSKTWFVNTTITSALERGFYRAFDYVEPTGKAHLLGVDVSGSMTSPIAGTPLSSLEAAAALAMVTARTEPNSWIFGFSTTFVDLKITATDSLEAVIKKMSGLPFSATDCAQPMIYAAKHKIPAEVFHVYTDSETWAGRVHPSVALEQFRDAIGINAGLAVVATASNNVTIADPSDPRMIDVAGFSADIPTVLGAFARGL